MSSIALVAIQSVRFPSAFLRMDGSNFPGVPGLFGGGFPDGVGIVNCQFYPQDQLPSASIGPYEVFELIPYPFRK